MTIPEGSTPGPSPDSVRPTRPEPQRAGPIRSREPGIDEGGEALNISEEVAHAVKQGYDVIGENIKLGRMAAEKFRLGEYNMRQVPGDLEAVGLRMLRLARELSNTTFDICERLLKEMGPVAAGTTRDRTQDLPAFRPTVTKSPGSAGGAAGPGVRLFVQFPDGLKATTHTASLARPTSPTAPEAISATPLAHRAGDAPPISDVKFHADVSQGGLVVTVTPVPGQPAGVYSGVVHAESEPTPLGVLTIEILT